MYDINKVMQRLLVFRKSSKSGEWGRDIGILIGKNRNRENTEKWILSSLVNPASLLL